MSKILQLDRHVADLIAAGEVVERPASAVKELVENAVDAGATHVTVEIQNGGMSYIRVTDNGSGIAAEDAETAFLRHATSKLRTQEDLKAIRTMGFRGEALAAISAVSKIDLLTKQAGAPGLSLHLEAGIVTDRSEAGCPDGTTIIVRDLFYNTPARLKFMKRDSVEASHVSAAIQQQALAHPEIGFKLIRDGETVLQTDGSGDLHSVVYAVFGRQLANDMVKVESAWENMKLHGFVTKPTATRGNRANEHFFVNGRPVRSKLLVAALEEAYANQMMTGRYPGCVLMVELPGESVDVNVHPAKIEVKFANERAVFDCVRYGVLGCLNKAPARPEMQLKPSAPQKPMQTAAAKPQPRQEPTFRTMTTEEFKTFSKVFAEPAKAPVAPKVAQAFSIPVPEAPQKPAAVPQTPQKQEDAPPAEPPKQAPVQEPEQEALPVKQAAPYRIVGEVLDTYIIIEQEDTVLFLDKHAAHERILFERFKKTEAPIMAQTLMVPATAQLTEEEAALILSQKELLLHYGFEIDDLGGHAVLRQIPADLDLSHAEDTLQTLARQFSQGRAKTPAELRDELIHTIACKAAIKAGWHTTEQERAALVKEVMEREDIKYCPHGRPVITTLTKSQLERQFKR
ncbi:MAG: DNA mismatch repair endonuclease MutL [Oscillospiraceae bacterium]|nr:DNA mismatch repair endonuclease MutL [Oscillospiraceae bacterium]